jgi:hypothetical protein
MGVKRTISEVKFILHDNCTRMDSYINSLIPSIGVISFINERIDIIHKFHTDSIIKFERVFYQTGYYYASSMSWSIENLVLIADISVFIDLLEFEKTNSYAKHFAPLLILGQ